MQIAVGDLLAFLDANDDGDVVGLVLMKGGEFEATLYYTNFSSLNSSHLLPARLLSYPREPRRG